MPVKIFVLNNDGYLSMRMSQGGFFERFIGEGPRSGITFPIDGRAGRGVRHSRGIGAGGGIRRDDRPEALAAEGPFLCEVMLDPEQTFEPKLSSRQLPDGRMVSSPLEDLFPVPVARGAAPKTSSFLRSRPS